MVTTIRGRVAAALSLLFGAALSVVMTSDAIAVGALIAGSKAVATTAVWAALAALAVALACGVAASLTGPAETPTDAEE